MFPSSRIELSITVCYEKNYFKKKKRRKVYYTPQETFENTMFKTIWVVFKQANI